MQCAGCCWFPVAVASSKAGPRWAFPDGLREVPGDEVGAGGPPVPVEDPVDPNFSNGGGD